MAAIVVCLTAASCSERPPEHDVAIMESTVELKPALEGAVMPVNIAAPSFMIEADADRYFTEIGRVGASPDIEIASTSAAVRIPAGQWHALLAQAAGDSIYIRVSVKNDGRWSRYADTRIAVSPHPIDRYLTYRLLYPGYELWEEMGIYQRDLTDYTETPVIENRDIDRQCVNCHSFAGGDARTMMIHVRGSKGGTLVRHDGRTAKVNPKCPALDNGATYPAWHPSGRWIAFSANKIQQAFHRAGTKTIEVVDMSADMTLYDVEADSAIAIRGLSGEETMETFPAWSPDGTTLYFCRAKAFNPDEPLQNIRYDLCRARFDTATLQFSAPEVVYAASDSGRSVSFPRVSPTGNWLLMTVSDYGNFSIQHPESDLWVMNLATGDMQPLTEANGEGVDSYHSWSSDGRWIVFSSKRMDGLWARPFITAFDDATGTASRAFALPQADPLFYDNYLKTYNIPELTVNAITDTEEFVRSVNE